MRHSFTNERRKNMKRLIFMVLCVTLVLSMNVCANEVSDEQKEVLKTYNIMVGDEGGLRLDDNITRAEFSKMIIAAKGISLNYDNTVLMGMECEYKDLTKYDWQFPYIDFTIKMGWLSAEDNNCNAGKEIKNEEALDVIVKVLGYDNVLKYDENKVVNNMIFALGNGISKGLTLSTGERLTRAQAAVLISQSLDVPLVVLEGFDAKDGAKYSILNGEDDKELRTLRTELDKTITDFK